MDRQIIEAYLLDYLKKKEFKLKVSGKVTILQCPYCQKPTPSAIIPPHCHFISCFACGEKRKTIFDLVKDFEHIEGEDNIIQYVKELLNLNITTKQDTAHIEEILKFYSANGFDLVPVARNSKKPIEVNWCNKIHTDIKEWRRWLEGGLNIGAKTSEKSGIIVIDVDTRPTPPELLPLLGTTLTQVTPKGTHYFYKHTAGLIKTRIEDLKTDIETDGTTGCGQVLLFPSVVEGQSRKINLSSIIEMPNELLEFLKSKMTIPLKSFSEKIVEDIGTENFNLNLIDEGNRNVSLLKLGGLFRKELNVQQTEHVLNIVNQHACAKPLHPREISAMVKSLSKYVKFDEVELAHKVLSYLNDAEEAQRTEIAMAIMGTNRGEDKMRIDKALHYLVKEQYIIKKGKQYKLLQKLDWETELSDAWHPLDFKVPYFEDVASFEWGDLILIGSKTKYGKTHIALNIIKQLVEQNKCPYYVSLESGSRFKKIALKLGLKEADFKFNKKWVDPMSIRLEERSIMIIDWLCPDNFAEVDKLFQHFTSQLFLKKALLIVFMQLKEDGSWFAPNLVTQFPALGAKYLYDEGDQSGVFGKFLLYPIRDAKVGNKTWEIPCIYDKETKMLSVITEKEYSNKININIETKNDIEIEERKL